MDRSLPILIVLCSAALPALAQNSTSPGAQAAANSTQQAAASGAAETSKIIFARNPDIDTPDPDAGLEPVNPPLSANLQGELAEGAPHYQPPAAVPASSVGPDLRAADKPKNDIPRLPVATMSRYVVKGTREVVFQGRDLYTTEALVDLSFQAHPGLRNGLRPDRDRLPAGARGPLRDGGLGRRGMDGAGATRACAVAGAAHAALRPLVHPGAERGAEERTPDVHTRR